MANHLSSFRLRETYDYRLKCSRCGTVKKPHLAPMVSCACDACWSPQETPEFLRTWLQCCYQSWKGKGEHGREKYVMDLSFNIRASIVAGAFSLDNFEKSIQKARPWPDELLWNTFRDVLQGSVREAVLEGSYAFVAF